MADTNNWQEIWLCHFYWLWPSPRAQCCCCWCCLDSFHSQTGFCCRLKQAIRVRASTLTEPRNCDSLSRLHSSAAMKIETRQEIDILQTVQENKDKKKDSSEEKKSLVTANLEPIMATLLVGKTATRTEAWLCLFLVRSKTGNSLVQALQVSNEAGRNMQYQYTQLESQIFLYPQTNLDAHIWQCKIEWLFLGVIQEKKLWSLAKLPSPHTLPYPF